MKLTIEGQELIQAIRRGLDFEIPVHAQVNIIAGRGANEDRAEIDWEAVPGVSKDQDDEEPPFEPDAESEPETEVDPDQEALPEAEEDPQPEEAAEELADGEKATKDLFD